MRIAFEYEDGWVIYEPTVSGGMVDLVLDDVDYTRVAAQSDYEKTADLLSSMISQGET